MKAIQNPWRHSTIQITSRAEPERFCRSYVWPCLLSKIGSCDQLRSAQRWSRPLIRRVYELKWCWKIWEFLLSKTNNFCFLASICMSNLMYMWWACCGFEMFEKSSQIENIFIRSFSFTQSIQNRIILLACDIKVIFYPASSIHGCVHIRG